MYVIIQCAASKDPRAGTFRTADGRRVAFFANPGAAPAAPDAHHVHPDDPSDEPGLTWRQRVVAENTPGSANSWGLIPAGHLYRPKIYRALIEHYGWHRVFILSAGWGLVRADWLLPAYDITFRSGAQAHHRRRGLDGFQDWVSAALQEPAGPNVIFFGGLAYLPLLDRLTGPYGGRRLVFFRQADAEGSPPAAPAAASRSFLTQAFITTQRTNWHYTCARELIEGGIVPDFSGGVRPQ